MMVVIMFVIVMLVNMLITRHRLFRFCAMSLSMLRVKIMDGIETDEEDFIERSAARL